MGEGSTVLHHFLVRARLAPENITRRCRRSSEKRQKIENAKEVDGEGAEEGGAKGREARIGDPEVGGYKHQAAAQKGVRGERRRRSCGSCWALHPQGVGSFSRSRRSAAASRTRAPKGHFLRCPAGDPPLVRSGSATLAVLRIFPAW